MKITPYAAMSILGDISTVKARSEMQERVDGLVRFVVGLEGKEKVRIARRIRWYRFVARHWKQKAGQ